MSYSFIILAFLTIGCGIFSLFQTNLVRCAVGLIGVFAGIAGLFFNIGAEFLGAIQLLVYVGAISVLLLFAIMITRNPSDTPKRIFTWNWFAGFLISTLTATILVVAALSFRMPSTAQSSNPPVTLIQIGEGLVTRHAAVFFVIAILLTAALVGSAILALEENSNKNLQSPSLPIDF